MDISVILCTHNRAVLLHKALATIADSVLPDDVGWEVIVVDNNSTDETAKVVEEFAGQNPTRYRYVFEARQGKSHALNRGIREARGDVLAFVDDDVTVEPTWLWNLAAPLQNERWAGVGGRTLMAESFSPPRWLGLGAPYYLGGILCAQFDMGNEPRELSEAPYGVNMAYRRKMFEKYGSFRTDLGPSLDPETPRPNEDTEFGRRLMAAGERLIYEPKAVVYHPVPMIRVQKKYFLDWWFDYGRAMVREWGRGPDVWGLPRPYLSALKIGTIEIASRAFKWLTAVDPRKRFKCKCWVWMAAGEVREFYRLGRSDARMHDYRKITKKIAG